MQWNKMSLFVKKKSNKAPVVNEIWKNLKFVTNHAFFYTKDVQNFPYACEHKLGFIKSNFRRIVIRSRKPSKFSISVRYTLFVKYPHTKKSRGFRSGDHGCQTTSQPIRSKEKFRISILSLQFLFNRYNTRYFVTIFLSDLENRVF